MQARRDIHAAFAIAATYEDQFTSPTDVSLRWHDRFVQASGDIAGGNYAQVFENIDRLIFDIAELTEKDLTLRRGGKVTLVSYGYTFTLDVREPVDGPVKVTWTVTRP